MQVGQQHGLLIAVAQGQLGKRSLELPRMRLDSIGAGPGSRLKRLALLGAACDLFAETRTGGAGLLELLNVAADPAELPYIVADLTADRVADIAGTVELLLFAPFISWMSLWSLLLIPL